MSRRASSAIIAVDEPIPWPWYANCHCIFWSSDCDSYF
jgi:hypothetical protein